MTRPPNWWRSWFSAEQLPCSLRAMRPPRSGWSVLLALRVRHSPAPLPAPLRGLRLKAALRPALRSAKADIPTCGPVQATVARQAARQHGQSVRPARGRARAVPPRNGLHTLKLAATAEVKRQPRGQPAGSHLAGCLALPSPRDGARRRWSSGTTRQPLDGNNNAKPETGRRRQRILTTSDRWAVPFTPIGQTAARTPTPSPWARLTSV